MDNQKTKIAYLTCNNEFGKTGLDVLSNYNIDLVYTNFGEKNIQLEKIKFDYLISFCYPYKVSKDILCLPEKDAINFHPAPLPNYKGFAVYNFGILNNEKTWGVTAHVMDENFDTGAIIKHKYFNIENETAFSLRNKSRTHLIELFNEILCKIEKGEVLQKFPQLKCSGNYYSKKMMNEFRIIRDTDTIDLVERKIRAFWCPPYEGAVIHVAGNEYTLVSKDILKNIYLE